MNNNQSAALARLQQCYPNQHVHLISNVPGSTTKFYYRLGNGPKLSAELSGCISEDNPAISPAAFNKWAQTTLMNR